MFQVNIMMTLLKKKKSWDQNHYCTPWYVLLGFKLIHSIMNSIELVQRIEDRSPLVTRQSYLLTSLVFEHTSLSNLLSNKSPLCMMKLSFFKESSKNSSKPAFIYFIYIFIRAFMCRPSAVGPIIYLSFHVQTISRRANHSSTQFTSSSDRQRLQSNSHH